MIGICQQVQNICSVKSKPTFISFIFHQGKSKKEKKQKKKDKLKGKVLQVDFGFAGDEGKELLGAHSVVDAQG